MTLRKLCTGLIAAAVAVAGLSACGNKNVSNEGSPNKAIDKSIKDFDFENVTLVNHKGEKQKFKDGRFIPPGYEGTDVGWHIAEGPKFADVDGDKDLDAALVYEWVAAAGASSYEAYIWTWNRSKATQVGHAILGGNDGKLSKLDAKKDSFTITAISRPYTAPMAEQDGEKETFDFALRRGFPVQTEPSFGAVDRCVLHDGDPPGAASDVAPRVAPDADAPHVGEAKEFTSITTIPSLQNTENWTLARAERSNGSVSCGWLKTDEAAQG